MGTYTRCGVCVAPRVSKSLGLDEDLVFDPPSSEESGPMRRVTMCTRRDIQTNSDTRDPETPRAKLLAVTNPSPIKSRSTPNSETLLEPTMHHLPSKALLPFELHALQAGLYYSMTSLPVSLPLAVSVSVCLSRSLSLSLSRCVCLCRCKMEADACI